MCHAGLGGVYALVSIVWFAAFYMTGAVPHVFLLVSGGHYFSEPLVSGRHFLPQVWVRMVRFTSIFAGFAVDDALLAVFPFVGRSAARCTGWVLRVVMHHALCSLRCRQVRRHVLGLFYG